MGLHFDDIRNVIHWGAPSSAIQYWQQAGRAGRDNLPASSHLYATRQSYHRSDECLEDMVQAAIDGKFKCARHFLLCNLSVHEMPRPCVIHNVNPIVTNCCLVAND